MTTTPPHTPVRARVLVDLLCVTGERGGMESYLRGVYGALSPTDPDLEYIGLASRELAAAGAPWFPGRLIESGVVSASRTGWAFGARLLVPRQAQRLRADIVHAPANIGPGHGRVPVVLTIHDLLPFVHPEYVPGPYGVGLRSLVRTAARHAHHILTVSAASRDDIVHILRVPAAHITPIPLAGSDPGPGLLPREPDLLLTVANRLPHKNLERLLEALALIPAATRPRLILTGSGPTDPLHAAIARLGLADSVTLAGWVDRAGLDALYARATALVHPTLFEGFGLPVLEAMARGCSVLCSDLPVLREVAGVTARTFDPTNPAAIATAIQDILALAPEERTRLAAAGLARATHFSWPATATATRDVFLRIVRAAH